ncbi:tRNA (guanosine(37)-N1)-methyltransferase TrmD [Candidatus Woesebacteria bacterium]|nr:tRNA (guanosine(37)-N1)-methyltransferase TrmD [Candidatus Woesebacteria bacterium]
MTIDILTLFPEYFDSLLQTSILGKAVATEKVDLYVHGLRQFGVGKHKLTDDRPYGGGPGMVMMIEPIDAALSHLGYAQGTPNEKIILTSAKGELFTQDTAREWQPLERIAFICGHYEGVDERVAQHLVDAEIRIGDYVLTGGEPAVAVMVDALSRLQPGVLGNENSTVGESHDTPGELGHGQYTRPAEYNGWRVPEILQSGDHRAIAEFRHNQHLFPEEK